jgi:hypothetical protein
MNDAKFLFPNIHTNKDVLVHVMKTLCKQVSYYSPGPPSRVSARAAEGCQKENPREDSLTTETTHKKK